MTLRFPLKSTGLSVNPPKDIKRLPHIGYESYRPLTQVDSCSLMEAVSRESDKIVIAMVGLPARGKTYLANKLRRYCSWLGFRTNSFNTSEYRRNIVGTEQNAEFFDPCNDKGMELRWKVVNNALDDLVEFLVKDEGQIAILDGTNVSEERQKLILSRIQQERKSNGIKFQLIWVESILEDLSMLQRHISETKLFSPDYQSFHPDHVEEDFKRRIEFYKQYYKSIEDPDQSFIRIYDIGRKVVVNLVDGYIQGRIVSFLMNLRISPHPIFFSRHGESMYNVAGKIGGDSVLSERGRMYAQNLNEFIHDQPEIDAGLKLWSSTLKRTIETASYIKGFKPLHWRALSEIEVGVCDGMTYLEVEQEYPDEFRARKKDKLRYRYPRGESYLDLIQRLEPVIFALEKATSPILVIGHRAVIRCLYAYFVDLTAEDVPHISVPLHTVIKMIPRAYGTDVETFELEVSAVDEESDQKLT